MKENFGFAKKVALLHDYNFLHCFGQLFEDGLGVLAGIREHLDRYPQRTGSRLHDVPGRDTSHLRRGMFVLCANFYYFVKLGGGEVESSWIVRFVDEEQVGGERS